MPPSVYHTETPNGIGVRYQSAPKRAYWVRPPAPGDLPDWPLEGDGWVEVPSVTTVLNCLDKPALPWWGMKIGVAGVFALIGMGWLRPTVVGEFDAAILDPLTLEITGWEPANEVNTVQLLTKGKLTVNHVRDRAGVRGTSTHDAMEVITETGIRPVPELYPEEQRGYVAGLVAFFDDLSAFQTLGSEIGVGSCEYLFAGRYDWRAHIEGELITDVRRGTRSRFDCSCILDLKTSKGVYASHFLQLEAYEGASVEGGYDATEERLVLHVTDDGGYEVVRSTATYADFLTVRQVFTALNRKG
jgi:hypothetical protein